MLCVPQKGYIFIRDIALCHNSKSIGTFQLEDLKVLKRSPDLLNNVKIGQGQLWLIIQKQSRST